MGWYEQSVGYHKRGLSVSEIAKLLDLPCGTVRNYIVTWWVETRAEEDMKQARLMYAHGLDTQEIAEQLHRDQSTIRRWVKE